MHQVELDEKVIIAFSTAAEGNMDERFADRSVVMANRRKFLNQFGLNPRLVVEGRQVHSSRILALDVENTKMWYGMNIPGVDGFVTNQTDVGLLIKVADCVPVVLFDPEHGAIALLHAGWQGTVKGIHTAAIQVMGKRYGTNPGAVKAWLGPSAKSCHYTMEKPEQADDPKWQPFIAKKNSQWSVDLSGYIEATLHEQGVLKKNMKVDSTCTVESTELFSHIRSLNSSEPESRFLVLAKLR